MKRILLLIILLVVLAVSMISCASKKPIITPTKKQILEQNYKERQILEKEKFIKAVEIQDCGYGYYIFYSPNYNSTAIGDNAAVHIALGRFEINHPELQLYTYSFFKVSYEMSTNCGISAKFVAKKK